MKTHAPNRGIRDATGWLLVECLVYISVFAAVFGLGLAAFYVCWDHSKALHGAADEITAALHAGERWRADVRGATGKITVETVSGGERLRIPRGTNEIIYNFAAGEVRRAASPVFSELLLANVRTSDMVTEARGPTAACRWELELAPRRKEIRLPLKFTFEAAIGATP